MVGVQFYERLWELRDKRVDEWFMMDSIWPTIIVTVAYLYFVRVLGPTFMKERKPIDLKPLMMLYNIVQVLGSAWMFVNFLRGGWLYTYSYVCQAVDRNPDPKSQAMLMANTLWWCYMSKIFDFTDTFFFIIRKKTRQISALHVFHHGVMPLYAWCLVRWLPGGQETFGALFNTFIHTLMYSYYFLSGLGPAVQKYLWWKRYLTRAQILQFVVGLIKTLIILVLGIECGYPWQWTLVTSCLLTIFLVMFSHFYIQEYTSKKKLAAAATTTTKSQ